MSRLNPRLLQLEERLREEQERRRTQWEAQLQAALRDHPDPPFARIFGHSKRAAELMEALGVARSSLVAGAYIDLLLQLQGDSA